MKRKNLYKALFLLLLVLVSCDPFDDGRGSPPKYDAVIVTRPTLENSTKIEAPRTIVNSGKIYVKENLLFVGEKNEGFHVFDNSDPSNPKNVAFLKVLGASDLAIKQDVLYINNAVDLIAVKPDIANKTLEVTKRVRNAFPEMVSPDGFLPYQLKENEIVVNWNLKK